MAKGGGRGRRSYVRDARGRFASTPGGGAAKKAKPQGSFRTRQAASLARQRGQAGFAGSATRKAKRQLKASAKRLKANASPQQKAAVTRARNKVRSLSPIRRMATAGRQGVMAKPKGLKRDPGVAGKLKTTDALVNAVGIKPKRNKAGAATTDKGKKPKVVVNIKRAAAGGEYGPDGHFYPAGSWMPLGKFTGDQKKPAPAVDGSMAAGGKQGQSGGAARVRVIEQKPKPRPRLQPAESTPLPQVDVSSRGMQNMKSFFQNGFYTFYKKGRDGFIEGRESGWLRDAAIATRIPPKAVGAAIAKLRKMAKDKNEFDATVAWERNLSRRAYGYAESRRGGYIPRGMTRNQYDRVSQLVGAVGAIAQERKNRPNNRRTGFEEYVWVFNNVLGGRQKRTPKGRLGAPAAAAASASRRPMRLPAAAGTMRPVSTNKLITAGGSRWQKDKFDRVYFNQPNTGKVYYDRTTRKMVNQSGDQRGATLAARMERAGRRKPSRSWKSVKELRRRKPAP